MPAGPDGTHTENAARSRSSGSTGARRQRCWKGVSPENSVEWCRSMFSCPPLFPGPSIMWLMSKAFKSGIVQSWPLWEEQAAQLDAVGFAPDDYLVLRRALRQYGETKIAVRADRRFLIDTSRAPTAMQTYFMVAVDWAPWLELVRSGVAPLDAVSTVVDAA